MDIFTGITKNVGKIIANIQENNKIFDELNKKYNPTFVEIIDELKEEDNSLLLALLYDWYRRRNNLDFNQVKKELDEMRELNSDEYKEKRLRETFKKRKFSSSGCGFEEDEDDYGGCGSSSNYSRPYEFKFGGCGDRNTGGC